ncbi:MAG: hypothetical protein ACLT98_00900 [Eggerthellaceae bacterium]
MDEADIAFCQKYFAEDEQRDPTITEIKMIDTYWSDHCRHTTFGTVLENVQIDDEAVKAAFEQYRHAPRARPRRKARLPHGHGHHRRQVAQIQRHPEKP